MTKPLTVVVSLLLCALVVFAVHRSLGSVRRPELTIATVNNTDMILSQQLSKHFEQQHGLKLNWVVLGENALRQRLTIFELLERLRRWDHRGIAHRAQKNHALTMPSLLSRGTKPLFMSATSCSETPFACCTIGLSNAEHIPGGRRIFIPEEGWNECAYLSVGR